MAFGLAVATAVIVGSLIVGDSVTGSLRDTATARLGRIDHALVSPHFFRTQLSADLAHSPELSGVTRAILPLILIRGAVESATTEAVVPSASVVGVDDSFWRLYDVSPSLSGRDAVVNASLARELGVKAGDSILVDVDKQGQIPSGTLFAHKSPKETLRSLRLDVAAVLGDKGVGGFRLDMSTDTPRNVFVSREWLASEIGKDGQANALVVQGDLRHINATPRLQHALALVCTLSDYGLTVVPSASQGCVSIESDGMLLDDRQLAAARAASEQLGARHAISSVYLAKVIRELNRKGTSIAYSVVAGVQPLTPFSFTSGGGSPEPGEGEIWLNSWAATDLDTHVGGMLALTYLVPLPDGTYRDAQVRLRLTGIVEMAGPANDPGLVPRFDGITDAGRIDEWHTPFPVDLNRITERDDEYWTRYKTTPKAFVNLKTVEAMWKSGEKTGRSSGWVTSLRLAPTHGSIADLKVEVERAMVRRLSPEDSGLVFRPIRRIALDSAAGTTDFGQLFMAMSFFLVLSGVGLAAMLMRLSAERRASEFGVMMACGFTPSSAVLALLGEGIVLSVAGVLLGVPLGVAYGWGIIAGLRSWWIGAVGTSLLWSHVELMSLAVGAVSGLLVGVASMGWSALRLRRMSALRLLSGWQSISVTEGKRPGRRSRAVLMASLAAAVLLLMMRLGCVVVSAEGVFFGIGSALLVAGMAAADLWLIRAMARRMDPPTVPGLASRNIAANRGRSLLVIGLLACAAFIIVTVAANTRDFSRTDYTRRDSGTGGFALRAISSSPVHYDLNSPKGRAALGFSPEDEQVFRGVRVMPFLMSAGDDISCLNLAKPAYPRVLAVSDAMMARGGFTVTTAGHPRNPWTALRGDGDGIAPVFGDASSVEWNLHSGLGKTYTMPGGDGGPGEMRFVGLVQGSIIASELLMPEARFSHLFPDVREPRYFLLEVPKGREKSVAEILRRNLGRMGFDVRSTTEILNSYIGVQNTYLSVFLALGGLGVILGTVGLVVVLLRSALERRREFALMLAQGFSRGDLFRLLISENAWLLVAGLLLGAVSALVAVGPSLGSSDARMNWGSVAVVFAGILVVGLASCAVAARRSVDGMPIEALRGE